MEVTEANNRCHYDFTDGYDVNSVNLRGPAVNLLMKWISRR